MAMHAPITSAAAVESAFIVSPFPYSEVGNHVTDAQVKLFNLQALLETIAELAEDFEGKAQSVEKARFGQIKRLMWVAMEERDRAETSIFESEGALLGHTRKQGFA